jgi:hypothetical protein
MHTVRLHLLSSDHQVQELNGMGGISLHKGTLQTLGSSFYLDTYSPDHGMWVRGVERRRLTDLWATQWSKGRGTQIHTVLGSQEGLAGKPKCKMLVGKGKKGTGHAEGQGQTLRWRP